MKINTELYSNSANTYERYTKLPVIQQGIALAKKDNNEELIKFLNGYFTIVNINL